MTRLRVQLAPQADRTTAAMAAAWAHALSAPQVCVAVAIPVDREVARVMREVGVEMTHLPQQHDAPADVTLSVGPIGAGSLRDVRDQLESAVGVALSECELAFDPASAAHRFALAPDMVFLNNGSFGATPRQVLAAQRAIAEEMEAQPIRFMAGVPERLRRAASRVADLLGGDPEGTVFVDNATSGVDTVLSSIDWHPGDVVVTTSHVYPAVGYALDHLVQRFGVRVERIEIPFPVEGPEQVVDRVRTAWPVGAKLAVFDHITSATGLVMPVDALVGLARERGTAVLVDGAHAPGQVPVDLAALGADYWVGNCHKWLFTPKSCAVLHVAEAHRQQVRPLVISHGYRGSLVDQFDFVGTRDYSGWLAVEAALDFVEEVGGLDRIRVHNARLRRRGTELVGEQLGLPRAAPGRMLASMETRTLPASAGEDPLDLHARLWERHRVEAMITAFADRLHLRTSAQLFNSLSDFQRLADALSKELTA